MREPDIDPEHIAPVMNYGMPYYGDGLFGIPGFLASAAQVPRQAWAPIVGTLIAWGLTQRLKFLIPRGWTKEARELSTQTLGFVTGFLGTALVWGPTNPMGWIVGFVVGLWCPALWNLGMYFIGRKWPNLRRRLSQNRR